MKPTLLSMSLDVIGYYKLSNFVVDLGPMIATAAKNGQSLGQ